MSFRYHVVSARASKGAGWVDESFERDSDALNYLMNVLSSDGDCLLAEIQRWSYSDHPLAASSTLEPVQLVAQAERVDGKWLPILGDLRCRTIGAAAEQLLSMYTR